VTRLWLGIAALAATSAGAPARACTTTVDYRVPTNFELTERADVIVLGRIEGMNVVREHRSTRVIVLPIALIKGQQPTQAFELVGFISNDRMQAVASDPHDLVNANPHVFAGACQRYGFDRGMLVLFFLQRHQGELRLISAPYARAAEDVPSRDAPWVEAVRIYADVAALPEEDRRQALISHRDRLRSSSSEPHAALIADDIDRQLASPRFVRPSGATE
jgi:hypothetical protein